jgi:hypothetical protein
MNNYDTNNNEYEEEDLFPDISRQVFIDIGDYLMELWNKPSADMRLVFAELVALHGCRVEKYDKLMEEELCRDAERISFSSCRDSCKEAISSDSEEYELCRDYVGVVQDVKCKEVTSIGSDMYSLSSDITSEVVSDDTDGQVFKYYLSDEDELSN